MVCRTDTFLETEQTHRVTLPDNWHSSLLHHRTLGTRHPLPPHWTLVLHQIIYDYLILYTHIYCQDARDFDIIVFCFLVFDFFGLLLHIVLNFSLKLCTTWCFCFWVFGFLGFLFFFVFFVCCCILYSTSLSIYVKPDIFVFGFLVFGFWFFGFGFLGGFLFFWFVVAYCTQLLSQAMYNLMKATTMAETCSC